MDGAPDAPDTGSPPPQYKNEGTALALSVVLGLVGIGGAGHMYAGKAGKGAGLLVLSMPLYGMVLLILYVFIGIGFLVAVDEEVGPYLKTLVIFIGTCFMASYVWLFFWQVFDARKLCRMYNGQIRKTGMPPW
ncbi:hypothetical protein CENSYa_0911 [Cenarchaeum symbiosum A]|uniref:TM2 domain-containing protein n=1 Tax=Cenarchaeum symbiosum (strain A) TaxID=414004 RepID=A0RW26_CENSY|nr:hypothetical protein CENSYa_0911 [Cenarchaeum symbiosum A]